MVLQECIRTDLQRKINGKLKLRLTRSVSGKSADLQGFVLFFRENRGRPTAVLISDDMKGAQPRRGIVAETSVIDRRAASVGDLYIPIMIDCSIAT